MKKLFIVCIGSMALAWGALAQTPTATPFPNPTAPAMTPAVGAPTATVTATAAASVTPTYSASVSPSSEPGSLADRIHKKFDKKMRHSRGSLVQIDTDGDSDDSTGHHHDDVVPEQVIPIIAIVMMSIFGAPVLIVGLLLYFGFSRNRMMHKTVRMMVEKGQPVPAALLNPPPHVRKRSDMRRGVIMVMIGLGLMIFLAAVNEGEGGAWAIGVIPFLIGVAYLTVWKLEKGDPEVRADNPPPLP